MKMSHAEHKRKWAKYGQMVSICVASLAKCVEPTSPLDFGPVLSVAGFPSPTNIIEAVGL